MAMILRPISFHEASAACDRVRGALPALLCAQAGAISSATRVNMVNSLFIGSSPFFVSSFENELLPSTEELQEQNLRRKSGRNDTQPVPAGQICLVLCSYALT